MEDRKNQFTVKIGNKTYIVCVKQSETAKKTADELFRDMCRQEVMSGSPAQK